VPTKHKLRAARDEAGFTQKQLSLRAGVSTSTISHIECHRGNDVPRSEWRPTKTKLSTAIKLAIGTGTIAAGVYTLEEFDAMQTLFPKGEIYQRVRRAQKGRPHLRLVA
jgi:transcriptional regulator with XRE-family HTH domain